MNKPVVVTEETLAAPVIAADIDTAAKSAAGPVYLVLGGISFSHFLNDTMQSLIPSVYPILKENYSLSFAQIGLITLAFQITASLLQPVVGSVTDRKPQPFSLAIGMGFTFIGLLMLSGAHNFAMLVLSAAMIGLGSAIFHPESSRIARMASGGRYGFAQSVFQVGGNLGSAIGPVLAALQANPVCDGSESCTATRGQFERMLETNDREDLDAIGDLAQQLQSYPDRKSLTASMDRVRGALANLTRVMHSMGMDRPGGLQSNLNQMRTGADKLADGSRQVADGVEELVSRVKEMGAMLGDSALFLLTLKQEAAQPTMAGFNIPSQILRLKQFKQAARMFISQDGHSVRYVVQTRLNPFSSAAMDQVAAIAATARGAQPNTALADATVSMTGYPVSLADTRDYYRHDIRFIIAATLAVVLLTLIALLRAIVAPLYLIASVVISYLSALGIGVLVFQVVLGQELHWSVPPLAFVVLVAVGADYNMLLVSRLRDESPHSVRYGVIRTLASTGGVITAAGLIFAASVFGLLFSHIGTVVQGGFVIGVGILLDTFLVRTVTVPAIAALLGKAAWWPSRLGAKSAAAPATGHG